MPKTNFNPGTFTPPPSGGPTRNPPPPPVDEPKAKEEKKASWGGRAVRFVVIASLGGAVTWWVTRKLGDWFPSDEEQRNAAEGGAGGMSGMPGMGGAGVMGMGMPQMMPIPIPWPTGGFNPPAAPPTPPSAPPSFNGRRSRNDDDMSADEVFDSELEKLYRRQAREDARKYYERQMESKMYEEAVDSDAWLDD